MRAYDALLKVMFLLPPERIHGIISGAVGLLSSVTPANRAMEKVVRVHDKRLEQNLFGVHFPAPLGLSLIHISEPTRLL